MRAHLQSLDAPVVDRAFADGMGLHFKQRDRALLQRGILSYGSLTYIEQGALLYHFIIKYAENWSSCNTIISHINKDQ